LVLGQSANLESLSPARRALAFHPEDSLFDAVVEAADATPKRSGLSSAFVILEHFYDKVEPWAMARTRRVGMRHERAQLAESPRFSPYRVGVAWTDWVVQRFYFNAARQIDRQINSYLGDSGVDCHRA
jgi:hypothetical protein